MKTVKKNFSATCDIYLKDEIIEDSKCSGTGDEKDLTIKNITKVIAKKPVAIINRLKSKILKYIRGDGKIENQSSLYQELFYKGGKQYEII